MKHFVSAVVSAVVLLSGVAFAQGPQAQQMDKAQGKVQGQGQQVGYQIPAEPKQFAQMLHATNQKEIKLGQLAQQKAQNQQVRDFAQQMVQDHQMAEQQLQAVAKTEKWKLMPPTANNAQMRAMKQHDAALEAKLKQLDGIAFDQAYMAAMVSDHDEAVAKSVLAQQQYQGTELARLAAELTPKLAQHREHAYRVLGQIASPAQLGVGGAGGANGMGMQHPGMGTQREGARKPMGGTKDSTQREGTLAPGGGTGTAPDARGGTGR